RVRQRHGGVRPALPVRRRQALRPRPRAGARRPTRVRQPQDCAAVWYNGAMIQRRQFLEGGALAAMAVRSAEAAPAKSAGKGTPEFYELRTIRLRIGPQVKIVNDYLSEVLVPAVTKLGAGPVGVFETMFGPEIPT